MFTKYFPTWWLLVKQEKRGWVDPYRKTTTVGDHNESHFTHCSMIHEYLLNMTENPRPVLTNQSQICRPTAQRGSVQKLKHNYIKQF